MEFILIYSKVPTAPWHTHIHTHTALIWNETMKHLDNIQTAKCGLCTWKNARSLWKKIAESEEIVKILESPFSYWEIGISLYGTLKSQTHPPIWSHTPKQHPNSQNLDSGAVKH